MRLTVFSDLEDVLAVVDAWLDEYLPDASGRWECVPVGGRLQSLYRSPQRGLELEQSPDWTGVRVKGEACAALGLDALLALMASFDGWRFNVTRLDLAWDGFPLSTRQTFDLLKAGDYSTRATLDPFPFGDLDADPIDGKGSTVYTHAMPEKRGINRYIRFYDKRGPVRCELVLRDEYARVAAARMVGQDTDTVSSLALDFLRGFIDLTHPDDRDQRASRRRLHPAWSDFVAGATPWRLSRSRERIELQGLELVGQYDGACQRAARRLCEAMAAFGPEWVIERLRYHGQDKALLTNIEQLKAVRAAAANLRLAGVHPWPDEYDADCPI